MLYPTVSDCGGIEKDMLISLLLGLAAADAERVFGNWAVVCDNVRRCEATVLLAERADSETFSQILISRDAGPKGGLRIAVVPAVDAKGAAALFVDALIVAQGNIGANLHIEGEEALRVARAMATGDTLMLRQEDRLLGSASLSGAAAAMRYIDAEQGRAESVTAIVATGEQPASMVPEQRPLPTISAVRWDGSVAADSPSLKALAKLSARARCERIGGMGEAKSGSDMLSVERYRLDARTTLVLQPCWSSAYNFRTAAFVLQDGKLTKAQFEEPDEQTEDGTVIVTNAGLATVDGAILSTSIKDRGPGDCGRSDKFVWDGARFRRIETRQLGECRGSYNWLTTYRAEPDWR